MTLAIPSDTHAIERAATEALAHASHLKLVRDIDPAGPFADRDFGSVASILGERHEVDDLLAQIESLQQEITLLHRRDETLSRTMRKLDEEQRLAARIQQDFLPKQMPAIGHFTFQALFKPAHYVSGDLYDVRRLDETHVGIYLADAVGHGMPAALLTMFMKNALVTKRITSDSYELLAPTETIATLNRSLRSQGLNHASFATALFAQIDCHNRRLRFARGGHPDPILIRKDGSLQELGSDGPLLGIFDDGEWLETSVTLDPGDRLFFYTDGVELLFGGESCLPQTNRWREELAAMAGRPTGEILHTFSQAVDAVAGDAAHDDLTLVIAECA